MKKALSIFVSLAMALSLCACGAKNDESAEQTEKPRLTQAPIAGGNVAFSVINELGSSITEIYVSETSSDDWGDNLLEDEKIVDGGAFEVKFSPEQAKANAKYDMAVVTSDSGEYHFEDISLEGINVITLSFNDDDEVTAELD